MYIANWVNSAKEETRRASQVQGKPWKGVETTWEVNLLNNRIKRPAPKQNCMVMR